MTKSKLSRLKPSFNELDYGQKLDLIMAIRASRRLRKRPIIEPKAKKPTASSAKTKKPTLTATQAAELLAMFSEEIDENANT